jgi:hypothetical protein
VARLLNAGRNGTSRPPGAENRSAASRSGEPVLRARWRPSCWGSSGGCPRPRTASPCRRGSGRCSSWWPEVAVTAIGESPRRRGRTPSATPRQAPPEPPPGAGALRLGARHQMAPGDRWEVPRGTFQERAEMAAGPVSAQGFRGFAIDLQMFNTLRPRPACLVLGPASWRAGPRLAVTLGCSG